MKRNICLKSSSKALEIVKVLPITLCRNRQLKPLRLGSEPALVKYKYHIKPLNTKFHHDIPIESNRGLPDLFGLAGQRQNREEDAKGMLNVVVGKRNSQTESRVASSFRKQASKGRMIWRFEI